MKEETELFFDSIMREDRSVMDLLNADYTFVNERLARHYGIPNIYGSRFRRVRCRRRAPRPARAGQHPHRDVVSESHVAGRARQVDADQPARRAAAAAAAEHSAAQEKRADGKVLPLRERMEKHRASDRLRRLPPVMDPIGFALENYDGTGRWRTTEEGRPIRCVGNRCSPVRRSTGSSGGARFARHPMCSSGVLTEKMMTYALGRGIEYYDMPAGEESRCGRRASNYRFSAIVLGVARCVPFQMKETK
jgi:hypothetical protein